MPLFWSFRIPGLRELKALYASGCGAFSLIDFDLDWWPGGCFHFPAEVMSPAGNEGTDAMSDGRRRGHDALNPQARNWID